MGGGSCRGGSAIEGAIIVARYGCGYCLDSNLQAIERLYSSRTTINTITLRESAHDIDLDRSSYNYGASFHADHDIGPRSSKGGAVMVLFANSMRTRNATAHVLIAYCHESRTLFALNTESVSTCKYCCRRRVAVHRNRASQTAIPAEEGDTAPFLGPFLARESALRAISMLKAFPGRQGPSLNTVYASAFSRTHCMHDS